MSRRLVITVAAAALLSLAAVAGTLQPQASGNAACCGSACCETSCPMNK